eukprot:evm.model.scf_131.10 EVM.evm.TU.scf_131.10   scf_131:69523-69951(-)
MLLRPCRRQEHAPASRRPSQPLSLALALLFLSAAVRCSALGDVPKDLFDSPHIAKLKRSEFAAAVSDGNVHFVEFYSEDCRQCQRFAPHWKALGETFKGRSDIQLAQVGRVRQEREAWLAKPDDGSREDPCGCQAVCNHKDS